MEKSHQFILEILILCIKIKKFRNMYIYKNNNIYIFKKVTILFLMQNLIGAAYVPNDLCNSRETATLVESSFYHKFRFFILHYPILHI